MGSLRSYRTKRDFQSTPEPEGRSEAAEVGQEEDSPGRPSEALRFVIQEHHARRLHWDLRLEREGALVSWALPRGIPDDPRRNHLAVHVEDHPLEYGDFEGQIPAGHYGAGRVTIWDRGTYETHKWRLEGRKAEVMVTFHGERVRGRYVLFQTRDRNWMIHRMDPPEDPGREAMPSRVEPMLARPATSLPKADETWAYEFKWDGIRAVLFCEAGSVRIVTRTQEDVSRRYPELRALARSLGSHSAVLDGEIVALGPDGVPRFEELQQRIALSSDADVRRRMRDVPVYFLTFDLIHLDGHSLERLSYLERRRRLEELKLAGPNWQTPDKQVGDGPAMLEASRRAGLEGVIAKRVDSIYEQGRRSNAWLKIKNRQRQELVIAGWMEGEGRRLGLPGALLVGYWDNGELVYAGRVGTGFTEPMLEELARRMRPLERPDSPFSAGKPPARAHFIEPGLVGEFEFSEWTRAGQVRAGSFKGLRGDADPRRVVRELPEP